MGTRGAYGVRIDGQDKLTYNHFDSYYDGLGDSIVEAVWAMLKRKEGIEGMKAAARELVLVDEDEPLTAAQKKRLKKYHDEGVSTGADTYSLLRNLQGDLKETLDHAKVMIDSHEFLKDSLFCEFAYVVNLDSEKLEVYQGFQHINTGAGRYQAQAMAEALREDRYAPVALQIEIPLDKNLKVAWANFVKGQQAAEEAAEDEG